MFMGISLINWVLVILTYLMVVPLMFVCYVGIIIINKITGFILSFVEKVLEA
jgi:hypothetical protein